MFNFIMRAALRLFSSLIVLAITIAIGLLKFGRTAAASPT